MFKALCACKTDNLYRSGITADTQLTARAGCDMAGSTTHTSFSPATHTLYQAVASMLHNTLHQSRAEYRGSAVSCSLTQTGKSSCLSQAVQSVTHVKKSFCLRLHETVQCMRVMHAAR